MEFIEIAAGRNRDRDAVVVSRKAQNWGIGDRWCRIFEISRCFVNDIGCELG
jgi:hypothetical protein